MKIIYYDSKPPPTRGVLIVKTKYFKFFPLVFVIVALVLAFLFSSASAVGVDDTAASSPAVSAGATAETEGTEESTEEETIYYDDTELLEKLDSILSLLQEEKNRVDCIMKLDS